MKRKRHTTDEMARKLREAEMLEGQGQATGQVCQALGFGEQTVWDSIPDTNDAPPSRVIGQDGLGPTEPNRGKPTACEDDFYYPYAFGLASGRFFVADTGNRSVLGWPSLPEPGEPPRWLIGQDSWSVRGENRDGPVGPLTSRWPHAVAGEAGALFIADAGNHRVLGWASVEAACEGVPPDTVARPCRLRLDHGVALRLQDATFTDSPTASRPMTAPWRSATPRTTACSSTPRRRGRGRSFPPTRSSPSPIPALTARTAERPSSPTRCAGPTACTCPAKESQSPIRATTVS